MTFIRLEQELNNVLSFVFLFVFYLYLTLSRISHKDNDLFLNTHTHTHTQRHTDIYIYIYNLKSLHLSITKPKYLITSLYIPSKCKIYREILLFGILASLDNENVFTIVPVDETM